MELRKLHFSAYVECTHEEMARYERIISAYQNERELARHEAIAEMFMLGLRHVQEQLFGTVDEEKK